MSRCPSCEGIIGRDCFNPSECAEIGWQQEHHRRRARQDHTDQLFSLIANLTERVEALEKREAQSQRDKRKGTV